MEHFTSSELGTDPRGGTGIPELDGILNGGFPRGHLFLIEGEPGTGKTTLGLSFLLEGAACGEKVMYVTLSESLRELEGVARSHNWSLDGVELLEYTTGEGALRAEEQYSAFHPSEVELQDTTTKMLAALERVQPQRVVLDSLSEIRLLARDSLRYRRQVLALKHYFANRDCTVLLLDDRSNENGTIELQSLAHGVIRMERLPREIGSIRRRLQVTKLRGSRFREGFHDYTIRTGGLTVFPRLIAAEHRAEIQEARISSGIAQLDALWGGGIRQGSSTLLIGPAGSGKSSVSVAYATAAARRGSFVSVYSFDESCASVLYRSDKLGLNATELFRSGKLHVEQIDPAEQSPGEFMHGITSRVERDNAQLVVIDSLNGFLNAMPGEGFLAAQMHELLSYLNHRGVTCILILAQAGLMGPMMTSPVDVSYLADNVMLFRYFEAAGKVRKAVSVVKMRGGRHEDAIRELLFTDNQLSAGEPLSNFRGLLTGVPTFTGPSPGRDGDPAFG
ncbi:MAG: AAA family ATPase [Acidobacteriota bacterium]|nr:AAA family ATPase [Acidobacteriota bacterium]